MQRRSPSAETSAPAVRKQRAAHEVRESINLRVELQTRRLIDEAAQVLGKTRTDFMIESARREAIDVLLDRRLFPLETGHYEAFKHALDNPPAPGPRLRATLRRVPAWKR